MTATQADIRVQDDEAAIRDVIQKWVVWRDAGLWDKFATVWHTQGYMTATWFQGTAKEFIDMSRVGFESGVRIFHQLGGSTVDVLGHRAIAQTKMTISQRAPVHGVMSDAVCTGRFYDFFAVEDGRWKIVRRQPIYEIDRLDPVDPGASLRLDAARLGKWPEGYRHLAYLQEEAGYTVKMDGLPGLTGPVTAILYEEGAAWLSGSAKPGTPE